MASKKSRKERLKIAKAKEAERLYYKEHPEELEALEQKQEEASKNARRKKDSQGKRIPSEAKRRSKGDVVSIEEHRQRQKAVEDDVKASKTAKTTKTAKARQTKSAKARSAKRMEYKVYSNDAKGKTSAYISLIFGQMKVHPFVSAGILLLIIVVLFSIITTFLSTSSTEHKMMSEDEKAISMIGLTEPAKEIVKSASSFDTFFLEEDSKIEYAKLFDHDITADEAIVLNSRGQSIDGNGIFAYNPDISAAERLGVEKGNSNGDEAK